MAAKILHSVTTLITIGIILCVSAILIAYGRGYRFDIKQKTIGSTGLISITSDPTGAHIAIDGKRVGATNTNISVKPGWYTVTISKEGYQTWEKKIRVQGEVVARADAMLFSTNPSLSTLTTTGVTMPTLSPDGTKLAFIIPTTYMEATSDSQLVSRAGIWVLDLIDKPLGLNRDARQILKAQTLYTDTGKLFWSPDSKQLLIDVPTVKGTIASYLVEADKMNDFANPVAVRADVIRDWDTQTAIKTKEKLANLDPNLVTIATSSMRIIAFSPDERTILYQATASATIPTILTPALVGTNSTPEIRDLTPNMVYTYNIKEDKNYQIGEIKTLNLQWLPTSKQVMNVSKDTIQIMDMDGTNIRTIYAGPFWDAFVAPWTNAGKLVILTNLNPTASTLPNLYAINIR